MPPVTLHDPLEDRLPTLAEVALETEAGRPVPAPHKDHKPVSKRHKAALAVAQNDPVRAAIVADFRVFLTLLWQHLLPGRPTPNEAQLDLAWYLQHGPDRSVILAHRGFSKSWITMAFGIWKVYCDPEEKILVVSGSQQRAIGNVNWALTLILTWPLLQHLKPRPGQKSSGQAFDVGPCKPSQSPSFNALGIGGQVVGFRATCIVPDDVETQTNSIFVAGREKLSEAVKEFDSILVPGGVIKFLGTPHDEDSLYNRLPERGYTVRIWPALFPTKEEMKTYEWTSRDGKISYNRLAPWVVHKLRKEPGLVGTPIMPNRFSMGDLTKRKLSLGLSEFKLQFMLDTTMANQGKYPLKVKDLMVMTLDPRRGPEAVVYSEDPRKRLGDLPVLGFDGDYYHAPEIPEGTTYSPYTRVTGAVDNSGRGSDETCLTICAELFGNVFWLHLWATKAGFEPETLAAIARACIRFRVQKLRIESNFGDGMFAALMRPVLQTAWENFNSHLQARRKMSPGSLRPEDLEDGGTEIEEVKASNQMAKERRILSILEPVTQQHRLIVAKEVIEEDFKSIQSIDGEDTRHRYAWGHQYTHITRDRDCLHHDDRIDSLTLCVADFADVLGVDPSGLVVQKQKEREEDDLLKLFGDLEDDEYGVPIGRPGSSRAEGLRPQSR